MKKLDVNNVYTGMSNLVLTTCSGITFIMYAKGQKFGKPNNLKRLSEHGNQSALTL